MPFTSNRKKYRPKFATDLLNGMRKDPKMTIAKCCQTWGVTRKCWHDWQKEHPEFRRAVEASEHDFEVACTDIGWDMITGKFKGDSKIYQLFMGVFFGMSNKTETKVTHDEQIKTININVVSGRKELPVDDNVVEGEIVEPAKKMSKVMQELLNAPSKVKYPKGYKKPDGQ